MKALILALFSAFTDSLETRTLRLASSRTTRILTVSSSSSASAPPRSQRTSDCYFACLAQDFSRTLGIFLPTSLMTLLCNSFARPPPKLQPAVPRDDGFSGNNYRLDERAEVSGQIPARREMQRLSSTPSMLTTLDADNNDGRTNNKRICVRHNAH